MSCNPLHSAQTIADGIHIPYAFQYANESARTSAIGFVSSDVGKFARQTDNDSIWMLTSTAPTWVLVGGSGTIGSDINEIIEAIQTILKELDGYHPDITGTEHYNQHSQAIQDILAGLDGYHPDVTGQEHYQQHSQALQTILQSLDGYNTMGSDISDLEEAIQTILKDLDGYALESTENQRWEDSSQQRQDIRDALDGYSSVGSVLVWGNEKVGGSTTTRYLAPGYNEDNAEVNPTQFRVPVSGTIQNMYVRHNDPSGNGNNIVYTLRINSVSSLLSVIIPSTSNDGNDLINTVAVTQGDLLDIEVTKTSSISNSPKRVIVTMEIL